MAGRKRLDPPRRQRGARKDGTISSLERHIEDTYGLPKGSTKIVKPGGRKKRGDARVDSLRDDYE